jgi:hypothetical protein
MADIQSDNWRGAPLHVTGCYRDESKPLIMVSLNRPATSDELLAFHAMLMAMVNGRQTAATTTIGGGEV